MISSYYQRGKHSINVRCSLTCLWGQVALRMVSVLKNTRSLLSSPLPGDTEPSYPRGWSRPGSPAAAAAARPRLASSPALTSVSPPLPTEDFEGENPQVPKLEKSISGTSPKRERLPLAVGIAFFLLTFWAS